MIVLNYFLWHYFEVPKKIFKAIFNFLKFGLFYFSVPFLLKTFFSHWHRYFWQYPRGFDIGKYFEVWFSNLISRTIGAILRSFLLFGWLLYEIFIFLIGIFSFLFWFSFPAILIFLIFHGAKILL